MGNTSEPHSSQLARRGQDPGTREEDRSARIHGPCYSREQRRERSAGQCWLFPADIDSILRRGQTW
jgi:hypothetical protein